MGRLVFAFVLVCAEAACGGQSLRDELDKAGIPPSGFESVELAQGVNAANARDGRFSYLVYMRVDAKNAFVGNPQVIRYDLKSGSLVRKELAIGEEDNCCGSPLGIYFTRSYVLFEFHLTPSASMIAVTDRDLKTAETLYGFGVREIAPDEVIFTEDMIHFAAAHAERIMLADLRTGASQELYPPKGDALRAAFAREHKQHMPSADVCMAMNDPCDPDTYDETIELLNADAPERFAIRVSRDAAHAIKDEDFDTVASDRALYVYQRRNGGWFYCSMPSSGAAREKPDCKPDVAVDADGEAEFPGPFVRKVK